MTQEEYFEAAPKSDILKLGEGNPGAVITATDMWIFVDFNYRNGAITEEERDILWNQIVETCVQYNILGPNLWILRKDYNDGDIHATIRALIEEDTEALEGASNGIRHKTAGP